MNHFVIAPFLLIVTLLSSTALADPAVSQSLVDRYAEISLTFDEDADLEEPFRQLLDKAAQHRDAWPDDASAWIASARVHFGYANTQGPIRGMRLMKQTRDELERAIAIDPLAGDGFPQAFLGYLYAGVPSWPISFGSKRKSDQYFEQARSINSESLEFKYLTAIVLASDGDIDGAIVTLSTANDPQPETMAASPTIKLYTTRSLELLERLQDSR